MTAKKWFSLFFILLLIQGCGQQTNSKLDAASQANAIKQCNANSGPICGQPPMPECPPGMFCAQVMPNPETYENDCKLKEANAQFISNGNCPSNTIR